MNTISGWGQGDQREPGIDHEHDHARQQHGKQALAEEDQAVTGKKRIDLQVDRGPAHQLAGLVAVEETKLEAHQVGVDLLAKIELDRQRDPAGDDPSDHREPEPQDRGKEDRPDQPEELLPVTAVDRVGGLADQGRDQQPSCPSPARQRPWNPRARRWGLRIPEVA